jgi:hypothetical protein
MSGSSAPLEENASRWYLQRMKYNVVEDNSTWWVQLGRSVWVGPFAERSEAVTWARGFAGDDRHIAVRRERQDKRKRRHVRVVAIAPAA